VTRIAGLATVALLAFPAVATAGAFGVEMGTPIANLPNAKATTQPNVYSFAPAQKHSEFDSYLAVATPDQGVCKVVGIGIDHDGDKNGLVARSRFDELTLSLSTKYGKSRLFDFLHAGSIWGEPGEWAMGLRLNERTYARAWSAEIGSSLPDGLGSIMLEAGATGPSTTYLKISYEFTNMAKCLAPQKKKDDSSL
jgi:hypothetical protein